MPPPTPINSNFIDGQCSIGQIHELFGYLLEKKLFTDISFSVKCAEGVKVYSAHKLILALWSPVLAEMCYRPCNEIEAAIRIEDISPDTFEAMLKFMYGSFSAQQLKDVPLLLKLCKGAVAYGIDALKNLCSEEFNCVTPEVSYVFQLLDAGKLLNNESLVQRCYKVLQMETVKALTAQKACEITPAMVRIVLEMPRVSFKSEYYLISWVLAWTKKVLLTDSSQKTFTEVLGDLLRYLNFLNLTAEEFAKLFNKYKSDLMSEPEGFSIFMNIALPGSHPLPSWCARCSSSSKDRECDIKSSVCEFSRKTSKKNRKGPWKRHQMA